MEYGIRCRAAMKSFVPLIDVLAGLLDAEEREAVLGDLAEAGASRTEAVTQLLGLVVRRYASDWLRPGPWLALVIGAIPIGILLSFVTRWWTDGIMMHLSWYTTLWFPGYFDNPGARRELLDWVWAALPQAVVLVFWSWTLGYTVARLCRQSLWAVAGVFLILLFAGTIGTTTTIARHSAADSLLSSGVFSIFGRIVLVVIPLLLGVRAGRANALPSRLVVAISTIAIIGLTMWTATPVEYRADVRPACLAPARRRRNRRYTG